MFAFLLHAFQKDDIYHAKDFFVAGALCTAFALSYAASVVATRSKKAFRDFSYGFRLLLGSGITMLVLAILLNALNPAVEHAILP